MNKYKNYIYLAICEITIDSYNGSNYSSYSEYCKGMSFSLKKGYLNAREKHNLVSIINMLEKIFSLEQKEIDVIIGDYFDLPSNKHVDFQEVVLTTKRLFPDI